MDGKRLDLISEEVIQRVPEKVALNYQILPIQFEDGLLVVACGQDLEPERQAQVEFILGTPIRWERMDSSLVNRFVNTHYQHIEAEVSNCESLMRFRCPKAWKNLEPTGSIGQRFCSECQKIVYLCEDLKEVKKKGREGKCVAFYDPKNDMMFLGEIDYEY